MIKKAVLYLLHARMRDLQLLAEGDDHTEQTVEEEMYELQEIIDKMKNE